MMRLLLAFSVCVGLLQADFIVFPSTLTVSAGEVFSLGINVDSITDLYAFQFDLKFDQGALQAISETEGSFLASGGPTLFIPGTIDNFNGFVTGLADSLEGVGPGVSGGGRLAEVTFQAIGVGSTSVNILNLLSLDSTGSGIQAGVQDANVQVVATPEPSYLPLVLLLGMCIPVLRQRPLLPRK